MGDFSSYLAIDTTLKVEILGAMLADKGKRLKLFMIGK